MTDTTTGPTERYHRSSPPDIGTRVRIVEGGQHVGATGTIAEYGYGVSVRTPDGRHIRNWERVEVLADQPTPRPSVQGRAVTDVVRRWAFPEQPTQITYGRLVAASFMPVGHAPVEAVFVPPGDLGPEGYTGAGHTRVGRDGSVRYRNDERPHFIGAWTRWVDGLVFEQTVPYTTPEPRVWTQSDSGRNTDVPEGVRVRIVEHFRSGHQSVGMVGVTRRNALGGARVIVTDADGLSRGWRRWTRIEEVIGEPAETTENPAASTEDAQQVTGRRWTRDNPPPIGTRVRILGHHTVSGAVGRIGVVVRGYGDSVAVRDDDGLSGTWGEWTEVEEVLPAQQPEQDKDYRALYDALWEALGQEANRRSWCSEYDTFARVHGGPPRPPRTAAMRVTVEVEVDHDMSRAAVQDALRSASATATGVHTIRSVQANFI